MKKGVCLLVGALIWCGSAQAATVISPESGTSRPYQRWIDRSPMPTPDVTLTVKEGYCPVDVAAECLLYTLRELWVAQWGGVTKRVFWHGMGHAFDRYSMTDYDRGVIAARMGLPSTPWDELREKFAETYRGCVLGFHQPRLGTGETAPFPNHRVARVCRQIQRTPTAARPEG